MWPCTYTSAEQGKRSEMKCKGSMSLVILTEMEPFPTTIDELKAAVQALWDEMDPCMFIHLVS